MDLHGHRERRGGMSVPQFGGWDKEPGRGEGESISYTVVFSQARDNRKQHKTELPRYSLDNNNDNDDLLHGSRSRNRHRKHDHHMSVPPPIKRRKTCLSWFSCFWA
ncbi:unnamed protein product [Cuscuta epithymum]|uniref:RIN4 pathogenic type III effector avirulence factor Avr cleavage site domain-containing protein n=1 Tax=Cuscuta epithymum TaxID=186058 RepID=A0AAV0FCI7_9ASTE|nr:unnamed protein product [Cuscuta epithymum]